LVIRAIQSRQNLIACRDVKLSNARNGLFEQRGNIRISRITPCVGLRTLSNLLQPEIF
jgi:hypothetical protein